MKSGARQKVVGAFDLIFLFGRGIEAFTGEKSAALRSLILPLSLFPLMLGGIYYYPPKGMEEGFSYGQIAVTVVAQSVLSLILVTLAVYAIASAMKNKESFWLYFEASNWAAFVFALLTLPISLMAIMDVMPREEMDRILALLSMYGYVVTGCILYRAFKLNWELAGALAIVTLFVNQELWNLLYALQGIPRPW